MTARREVRRLATESGFNRTDGVVLATAVSEVARNIVRFAGSGVMLIQVLEEPRVGIRESRVAFLHPKSTGKVLTELTEPAHH